MRNKFKAQCYYCGLWCEKGTAFLHRAKGKWYCHCLTCHDSKEFNLNKPDVRSRKLNELRKENANKC